MATEDLIDELRVTNETPESIKARLLADTNAGIDPNDPAYADTSPGQIWDDLNGARVLEDDRIYDRMNQVVAAAIPATATGAALDAWAQSLGLIRKAAAAAGGIARFDGAEGKEIPPGTRVSTPQISGGSDPVSFTTNIAATIGESGFVLVPITATAAGAAGKVPANTITLIDTPGLDGVTVTNPQATTGGSDVETDERLSVRVNRKLSGAGGAGNVDDYIDWGLDYPGVGFVTVKPNTPAVGHVTMLITDVDNDPMPAHAVDGLQTRLDPSDAPAQGAGLAPVGATVHVETPTGLGVTIAAPGLVLEQGYSLDGEGGTRALRAAITESLRRYIDRLPVGAKVVRNKVIAAIVDVVGVANVDETTLEINGSTTGDLPVGATEVATLTTVALGSA